MFNLTARIPWLSRNQPNLQIECFNGFYFILSLIALHAKPKQLRTYTHPYHARKIVGLGLNVISWYAHTAHMCRKDCVENSRIWNKNHPTKLLICPQLQRIIYVKRKPLKKTRKRYQSQFPALWCFSIKAFTCLLLIAN